jgi:hypothetical protein
MEVVLSQVRLVYPVQILYLGLLPQLVAVKVQAKPTLHQLPQLAVLVAAVRILKARLGLQLPVKVLLAVLVVAPLLAVAEAVLVRLVQAKRRLVMVERV